MLLIPILAGCSQTDPGAPEPTTIVSTTSAAATKFGVPVTPADQQKLELADRIRTVDPCGLFDRDRLATHGKLTTLGPYQTVTGCRLGLLTPQQRDGSAVHIVVTTQAPTSLAGNTVQIFDETAIVTDDVNPDRACALTLPVRFPERSEPGAQDRTTAETAHVRVEAGPLIEAIVLSGPPRELGKHQVMVTLSAACSVIDDVAPIALDLFGANR
ncbi:hypothetical protein FNL39_10146 [Nocardia caishijiensis]|uniref:DUF5642 domain-containing protein n=2 Tax=Nocardia caishijiensis TaxID=184756 RepID=A0ABQ6YT21_9NOCA|nr:hypothetical protein FNL39_10146 [Nocardia caishijiensis]